MSLSAVNPHRLHLSTFAPEPGAITVGIYAADQEAVGPMAIEVIGETGEVVHTTTEVDWFDCPRLTGRPEPDDLNLFVAKVPIPGLDPGRRYEVRAKSTATDQTLTATAWTQPAVGDDRLTFVFGSCHATQRDDAKDGQMSMRLTKAYRELTESLDPGRSTPVYNLWLGDQLYVDAPWTHGFKLTIDSHREILRHYRRAWGLETSQIGLPQMMGRSSNWFIPDDHEFWNNYPRASFITLFWHTTARVASQAGRFLTRRGEPSHPFHHGAWGREAGAAYMAFQTPAPTTYGDFCKCDSPPPIQTISTDSMVAALVDTRWNRTMSTRSVIGRHAGFMTADAFGQLISLLDDDRLVVLGLARPLIGMLSPTGPMSEELEIGPENYRAQYHRLWRALARRAERGRPTIVLAGDVHHHTARTALEGGLLELVSSPIALLPDLESSKTEDRAFDGVSGVVKWAQGLKGRLVRRWWPHPTGPLKHYVVNPADPGGDLDYADGVQLFPADESAAGRFRRRPEGWNADGEDREERSGLAALSIDTSDPDRPSVRFRLLLEDAGSAGEPNECDLTLGWDGSRWVG